MLPGHTYFAVFDGHAEVEAATYAKCHLLCNIIRHPLFSKDVSKDVTKAVAEGIVMTDKNFCSKAEEEVRVYVECNTSHFVYCRDACLP